MFPISIMPFVKRIFPQTVTSPMRGGMPRIKNLERDVLELASNFFIKPKNLIKDVKNCAKFIDYKDACGRFVYSCGYADTRFNKSLMPKTLPVCRGIKRALHISNFSAPYGTIAISGKLSEAISTDGLLQCAAVAIVDRKKNIQTLIHFCPGLGAAENRTILDYILSASKNGSPEITIVPGCYEATDRTVSFLVDNIRDILGSNFKIKFANLADKNKNVLILKDGLLSCIDQGKVKKTATNPRDRIIYCSKNESI